MTIDRSRRLNRRIRSKGRSKMRSKSTINTSLVPFMDGAWFHPFAYV